MTATAILLAAGSGVRFGSASKAFWPLAGRPLISYSLDALEQSNSIECIVLVAGDHTLNEAADLFNSNQWSKLAHVVLGGPRRQDSVRSGLANVSDDSRFVAVHDAARPLIRAVDIDRCVAAAEETGAAILAVRVADTIKRVANDRIVATVPRDDLWAAQTPQVFDTALLKKAFLAADKTGLTVTDEAGIFDALGMDVAIVEGSTTNLKITVASDLIIADALIAHSRGGQDSA